MPTWIHTVAAAAVTGWSDQMVVPTPTRCWTQPGDELAAGRDDRPGQAQRHGPLDLQQAVEQPEDPEGDPEQPAGRRLGVGPRAGNGRVQRAGGHRPPVVHGAGHVPGQGQDHPEDHQDHELVVERGAERRGDGGVVGLESVPHSWHVVTTPCGPDPDGGPCRPDGTAPGLGGPECRSALDQELPRPGPVRRRPGPGGRRLRGGRRLGLGRAMERRCSCQFLSIWTCSGATTLGWDTARFRPRVWWRVVHHM